MAGRSRTLSSSLGKTRAMSMEPAPKHASAMAVDVWVSPICDCTSTTVLTITMALPAATARFSANSPRSRGVAR